MATCKDCIHTDVCRLPFNTSKTKVEFADVCRLFKNKADFVEVVRCKDCEYYILTYCACIYPAHNGDINFDGYCSYGERRCSR